jgi:hypothetical protein
MNTEKKESKKQPSVRVLEIFSRKQARKKKLISRVFYSYFTSFCIRKEEEQKKSHPQSMISIQRKATNGHVSRIQNIYSDFFSFLFLVY